MSGHRGHRQLHPSAVVGLIFERKDGNLNSSFSGPPVPEAGGESHITLEPPISTLPIPQPQRGQVGVPSSPWPSHAPGLLSSSMWSKWDRVTLKGESWDVSGGG